MSRPKFEYRTISKETYNSFCKLNPSVAISYEDYKKVIHTYNSLFIEHMLETGERIKMPYGLGTIGISKFKPAKVKVDAAGVERPGLGIDWKQTKLQGKYVYHLNSHTDGYKFYWRWDCKVSRIKCYIIWKFEMCRVNSRLLKCYLKLQDSKYKDIYREYNKASRFKARN